MIELATFSRIPHLFEHVSPNLKKYTEFPENRMI